MTRKIDQFWISRGLKKEDLLAVKGRSLVYGGLAMMAGVSVYLCVNIAMNLLGGAA